MGKSLNLAAALAVCASLSASGASAQTANSFAPADTIMQTVSASEVAAMMAQIGVKTQLVSVDSLAEPILLAETQSGARFLFYFFGCAVPAQSAECASTVVSTGLPMPGVPFDALNDFNGEANVTVAVSVPGEQLIMFGRNILIAGGHSKDLFQATVYLFLTDVSSFAQKNAGVTSVAFAKKRVEGSKISGRIEAAPEIRPFGVSDLSPIVAAAIENTGEVSFSVQARRRP